MLISLFLLLGATAPAMADTAGPTYGNTYPANGTSVTQTNVTISLEAHDPDFILASSLVMTVDGVTVSPIIQYAPIDESTDDYTTLEIYYPTTLTQGTHNVNVSVADQLNNPSSVSWSFNVGSPPKIVSLSPANGADVVTRTPEVSATVTSGDNVDPSSILMTLDNIPVNAVFDNIRSAITYTPTSPLTNEKFYNVAVSFKDITTGSTVNATWQFYVNAFQEMTYSVDDGTCQQCHDRTKHLMASCTKCHGTNPVPNNPGYPLDDCYPCHFNSTNYPAVYHNNGLPLANPPNHPVQLTASCVECHDKTWPSTTIPSIHNVFDTAILHNSTTTGCTDCHSSSLTREHQRRVDAFGDPLTCFTCHNSTNPAVQNAIASKNSSCEACHTTANHSSLHTNPSFTALPTEPDMNCSGCHNSSISDEHIGGTYTSTKGYNCDTCHQNTRPEVAAAITGKNLNCEACHIDPVTQQPKVHTTSGSPLHDTTYVDVKDLACEQCHANNIKTVHVGQPNNLANNAIMTCDTCHKSSDPLVVMAIASKNTNCDTCHIVRHANVSHSFPVGYVTNNPNNLNCADCHQGGSLTDLHVNKITKSGVAMTCDTCHGSATPTTVKAAVTAGQANCDACHTVHPDDAAKHTNPTYTALSKDTDMDCALCHTSVLSDEHLARKDAVGANYTCGTCHNSTRPEVKSAIANNNLSCEACHIDQASGQPNFHTSANSPLHDSNYVITPEVNCAQCHDGNLKTQHVGKINSTTNLPMDCATCHQSGNPLVVAAITAKNNSCDACHTYPPVKHQPKHATDVFTTDTTRADSGTCVTCHKTTALKDLHIGKVNSTTGQAMNCDTCHTSTDAKVVNAISTKTTNSCEACHTVHAPKDAATVHNSTDVFAAQTDTDCASCHDRNVKAEHIDKGRTVNGAAMTCDSCHASTDTKVINAISTNNNRCDACHTMPPAKHNPTHSAQVFSADNTRTDLGTCQMCHTKALPDQHVNKVTAAGVTMDCQTCHSSNAAVNVKTAISSKNDNCEACHTVHPVKTAVAQHDSTGLFAVNADVSCTGCHQRNIRSEHMDNPARTTSTGQSITCDTCHQSGNPLVVAAITAKNNSCDACHTYPTTKHQPVHAVVNFTSDTTRSDDCSMCHVVSTKDQHVGRIKSTGGVMNCDTCHASADTKVVNAISVKQTATCEACHTVHAPKDVTQLHDSVNFTAKTYTDPNMNCTNCHNSSLAAEHVNKTTETGVTMTCDTCHKNTRTDVQAAIASNNLKCEACHTKVHTSPDPSHTTTFVTNKTLACEKCHNANSIASDHLNYKTSTGAAITCDTCHKSIDSKVVNAIRTSSTGCDTCHTTRHSDIQTPHKTTYILNTAWNCSNCHAAANIAYNMTASYHKIAGITPTTNLLQGGTFVSPWTATSTLTCRDCHNKNTSTNAYYGKLLRGAYTSTTGRQGYSTANQLCFFCHSTSTYGPGSSTTAKSGFNGDGGKNWHSIGNHTEKGGCMSCHTSKPHSGSKQALIAIRGTAEPNSRITAFTHATSYSKSNCTTYGCH